MIPNTKYIWCLHCERVALREDWVKNDCNCVYEGCSGSELDAWAWYKIVRANPLYPTKPEFNKEYALYG